MKNSSVILIVMIITSIIAIYYIYRVDTRVNSIEGRVQHAPNMPYPHPKRTQIKEIDDARHQFIEENPSGIELSKLAKIEKHQPSLKQAKIDAQEISVAEIPTTSSGGINMEMMPLPFAGRFYETGEFHVVGHLSKADKASINVMPATLPLYGQRIPANQATWQYVVLMNNARHSVSYVSETNEVRNCLTDKGCREFKNDDFAKVPDISLNDLWRVKMYSKL